MSLQTVTLIMEKISLFLKDLGLDYRSLTLIVWISFVTSKYMFSICLFTNLRIQNVCV